MWNVLQSVAFITKSNGTLVINWTHTIFQTCHIFRYILLAFVLLSFILSFLFFPMTNLWNTLLQIIETVLAFLFYYPVPFAIRSRLLYTGAPNRFWECRGQKLLDVMENDTKTNFQERLHPYAYNNGDTISEIKFFIICVSLYRVCSVLKNRFVQFNMAPIGHLSDQS